MFITIPLAKMIFGADPKAVIQTAMEPSVLESIFLTLKVALYATLFVALTGIPLAYLLARYDFFGKSVIEIVDHFKVYLSFAAEELFVKVPLKEYYALLPKIGESVYIGFNEKDVWFL